jgi:hypothetical protein
MPKVRQRQLVKAAARHWQPWREVPITEEMRAAHPHLRHCASIFSNHKYECQCFEIGTAIGGVMQCNIVRHGDIEPIEWEQLQAIIHELFGADAVAVEIFPALANEWHQKTRVRVLWVLPSTWPIPFGLECPSAWGRKP